MEREEDHVLWWKNSTDEFGYRTVKTYLDELGNGCFTVAQKRQLESYLGDTPNTLYFIGWCCFYINDKKFDEDCSLAEVETLKRVDEYKNMCENLIKILKTPFPKSNEPMTSDQDILHRLLRHNWEHLKHRPNYVDVPQLTGALENIYKNSKAEEDNPTMELVVSRQGARRKLVRDDFFTDLIRTFIGIFKRLPVLSDNSHDFEALCIIADAYGWQTGDKLKYFKKIVKAARDNRKKNMEMFAGKKGKN